MDPNKYALIIRNLGAFACNPSHSARKSAKSSDLLVRFSDAILLEYAINRSNILTASVDYSGTLDILRLEPVLRRLRQLLLHRNLRIKAPVHFLQK